VPDGVSSVKPRRARAGEAREIADLWIRSRAASVPAVPPPVHADDEVRARFEEVVLPAKEVWVADKGGAVVALLVLDEEWIDQLYVHPGHTGRGIGAQLVAVAKQQRPTGLKLWTFEANAGARRFYECHEFVATGATAGDNEEGTPDVRYEWRPAPPAPASLYGRGEMR
jgi:GNAT superfamily N-acetyltransferase